MRNTAIRAAIVGLLFCWAGSASPVAQSQPTVIQRIIVKVNGEILTQTELELRQIQTLQAKNKQVDKPADLQNDATLRALLAEVTPDILVSAVDELLLVQRGREMGFHLSDDQFKNAVDGIKKENKLDDAAFKAALAQEHLTLDILRQNLERQYLRQGVEQQDIMQHVNLTDEEARQYYQKHPKEFMTPETVRLREIFVAVATEGGQAADDEAKAKISAARDRVAKGEDIAKVAAEVSDSPSKSNGGLMGEVKVADMNPDFRDIIDKLKVGEMSEPVRTPRGYQFFKVDTRSPEQIEAFDKVRDQIAQKVYNERLDGETKKYLEKLRAQALIEWKVDDMKKMYEKRIAEQKRGQ